MPMHDWTRVKAKNYHHFHGRWIYAIADALNAGILPAGLRAMAEHTLRAITPDVLALEAPDEGNPATNGTPAGNILTALPRTRLTLEEKPQARTRTRRIAVRTDEGDRVVAFVELVSPGNKSKRSERNAFVEKAVGALETGIHVLMIDPFPPSRPDPDGMHDAIWHAATGQHSPRTEGKPLTLAAYASRSSDQYRAFVEPVAVGDVLPDMPLYLTEDGYVPVPLEATYNVAWDVYPAYLRKIVAGTA